jgi:hypothetical protein
LLFLFGAPAAAMWFGNDRVAVYLAFAVIVYLLNEGCSRLFDLSVRLSRTNELLIDGQHERRYRKTTEK